MSADCTCRSEIGDVPCAKHDCDPPDVTEPHVQAWRDFLRTVEVRGPIPIRFRLHRSRDGLWILESKMLVPDRDTAHEGQFCGRVYRDAWITFDNALPGPDIDKALIIRQRVFWLPRLTRPVRHRGNHRYLWCLDRRRRREVLRAPAMPYPKIEARAA